MDDALLCRSCANNSVSGDATRSQSDELRLCEKERVYSGIQMRLIQAKQDKDSENKDEENTITRKEKRRIRAKNEKRSRN